VRALPGAGRDQTRLGFAEQRVREEVKRQCQKIGIPWTEY
jgi:hypothetical protein